MKIIISPAKKLLKKVFNNLPTTPIFNERAIEIANHIKQYSEKEFI
ncbi:MAG: hypothetical protein JJE21_09755 [Spirochaetaceae bacterium]|nr:hypothetical protein [Spirochaetaceae bacterium]